MVRTKPLGIKAYGSIPHLPGSKLYNDKGIISPGQVKILTEKKRDRHDLIIIQEKLDGSCVSVANLNGILVPLTRSGYIANTSPYRQHHVFYAWVYANQNLFEFLNLGERICGEWMLQAHGTKYQIDDDELFRPFDIIGSGFERLTYYEFVSKIYNRFLPPHLLNIGEPKSVEWSLNRLSELATPCEKPEGVVYRCERKGKVDFLAKYVRNDYVPGKYLGREVWNYDPNFVR